MNEVFNFEYKNPDVKRLLRIYMRTRSNRIKNKLFNRIFGLCLNEKGVIILEDVVIMKYDLYKDLIKATKMTGTITDKLDGIYALHLH